MITNEQFDSSLQHLSTENHCDILIRGLESLRHGSCEKRAFEELDYFGSIDQRLVYEASTHDGRKLR